MNKSIFRISPYFILLFIFLVFVLMFSSAIITNATPVFFVIVAGAIIDHNSCDINIIWGCGGGGGDGGGGGGGGGGSCGEGEQLCAGSCIPADADCCADKGFASYCAVQQGVPTYCTSSGQCRTTPCASNDGQTCSSPANSCGQTSSARYNCDGVCNAGTPPDSSCPNPEITISARGPGGSQFVNRGSACTIKWSTTNATSCTLTGPGLSVTGTSGQIDTPPLQQTTTFNLTCKNGTVVTASKEVICYLTPHFEEF